MWWAMHLKDRKYMCVRLENPQTGQTHVFRPIAMGMGGRAAPQQYARIPCAMCHILHTLAGISVVHHLDDFMGVEVAGCRAASAQNAINESHCKLGIKRNTSKSVEHAPQAETLGIVMLLLLVTLRRSTGALLAIVI